MPTPTNVSFDIKAENMKPKGITLGKDALDGAEKVKGTLSALRKLGMNFDKMLSTSALKVFSGDSLQPTITTASITTPVQFLQNWLPGFVRIITAARNIDLLVGMTTTGAWEDEEVVQGVMEHTGTAVPYGDLANIPLASWNVNFNRYTVVRQEQGMQVTALEQARAARMNVNTAGEKRAAAASALEIIRNTIGFYGFNGGANRTYGFLNAPGLPAYVPVAVPAGGSAAWSTKTFLQIQADLLTAFVQLQNQSQDTIDPFTVATTLAVATGSVGYLGTTSDFGISVRQWLKETYPMCRVASAPELNSATASTNVFYLYADQISGDGSTDDGKVFMQVVPTKFQTLGVQAEAKGFKEDYSNATAGVICKRPYGVVRYNGI